MLLVTLFLSSLLPSALALDLDPALAAYDSNFKLDRAQKFVYFSGAAYCSDPRWVILPLLVSSHP
jgi:hypothetical protein